MSAGAGCIVSPGSTESVIPLHADSIPCKGRLVANPESFLATYATDEADAASSSADNATSAALLV